MADQGTDARGHRHLSVAARTAGDPSRDLRRLSARRFLGRLDRRLGIHTAEFFDRRRIGRALCPARRSQAGHRDFLRRQSGGDRADSAFLLSAPQAPHGGQAAMGESGRAACCARAPPAGRAPARPGVLPVVAPAASGSSLGKLLLFFLKAGSLTFGSGLVIVPFLEQGVVAQYGWLDQRQFLIAVAVGMISPGPVVITATFVGYLVAGFWGSVVATVGIFFPSFIFILVAAPLLARHGKNPNVQGFVRGAYGAAIGTILGACILLGRIAIGRSEE